MSFRILLADESSTIKKAFEIGLTSYGAEIKNVQHGIDVLEVAETFRPDIIFADVLISKMNGYEVCAQLKDHPVLQTTPVVLMWSGFMDIDEDKYITCHADGKIEKPFSADQLIQLIHSLVQNNIPNHKLPSASSIQQTSSVQNAPPGISTRTAQSVKPVDSSQGHQNSVVKRQANPTEELLFKDDLKSDTDLFGDFSTGNDDSNSLNLDGDDFNLDNINLDNFEALDLQDNQSDISSSNGFDLNDNYFGNFKPSNTNDMSTSNSKFLENSIEDDEDFKEITAIPTVDQERELFNKLKEDTDIRHGSGFLNSDFQNELVELNGNLEDIDALDLGVNGLDVYGQDLTNDLTTDTSNIEDIFSNPEEKIFPRSTTIHRTVNDLHNSDAGLSAPKQSMKNNSTRTPTVHNSVNPNLNPALNVLSREEIKQIVADQAKEMIQSIVWEMIPELSKQMIEKEIKRLLAESNDDSKPNSSF